MSLPYFPMYPTDFEAKTSHLTLAEDGAYNRLLRLMWMTPGCSLPDDDAWILRRMRCVDEAERQLVLGIVDEFCIRKNGRVSNARLTRVFEQSDAAHKKRVSAGSKGGKAKALKTNKTAPSNAKAKPKQPEPEPEPLEKDTNVSLVQPAFSSRDFQDFWDAYPHRNGKKNRKGAEASFARAIKAGATVEQIAEGVRNMQNDPDVRRGYPRDPTTWLNQQGWTDEFQPTFKAINGGSYERPHNSQATERTDPALEQIARLARTR